MSKIVIELPEKIFNHIDEIENGSFLAKTVLEAVKNGICLPKDCERIGDLDALYKEIDGGIRAGNYEEGYDNYAHINSLDDCLEYIKYSDSLLEEHENVEEQDKEL